MTKSKVTDLTEGGLFIPPAPQRSTAAAEHGASVTAHLPRAMRRRDVPVRLLVATAQRTRVTLEQSRRVTGFGHWRRVCPADSVGNCHGGYLLRMARGPAIGANRVE